MTSRAATALDADAIARIYNHYVTETVITFEEDTVIEVKAVARGDGLYCATE